MPPQDSIIEAMPFDHMDVTQHCLVRVSIWLEVLRPAIFKIGIAAEPLERWEDYQEERKWHFMEVLWRGPADRCRQLEMDLIGRLSVVQGCDNIMQGGDGVRPDRTHDCIVYAVLATAGDGPLAKAVARRREEGHQEAPQAA